MLLCLSFTGATLAQTNKHDFNSVSFNTPESVIFYYNKLRSIDQVINFDRIVVEPSLISQRQLQNIQKSDSLVFAYLSIGELSLIDVPHELSKAVLVENETWQSKVMDLSSPIWQAYLYEQARILMERGFDGVFLDTLDSYQLIPDTLSESAAQSSALVEIIDHIQALSPDQKLILNRGFESVKALKKKPYAVLVESMHHAYSPTTKSYTTVSESDTQWLRNKLDDIAQQGIEIMVIDYLPASDRDKQIAAAKYLVKQAYTPYVSDGMLYEVGISTVVPIARRVLGFYNGQLQSLLNSECHRMLSMPLEYLGYIPDCRDVHAFNFETFDVSQYAAIVFWIKSGDYDLVPAVNDLIESAYEKLPMLFLETFPNKSSIQTLLGVQTEPALSPPLIQVKGLDWTEAFKKAQFNQFETADKWRINENKISPKVVFEDHYNTQTSYVFSANWGGAALDPYPLKILANQQKTTWMLDPFRILEETLHLPPLPVPDITTESGRRLLLSHVDGDGFPSKSAFPNNPFTAEILRDNIFSRYKIPHTVSIIQGEIYSGGLFPKISATLEEIARSIFKIANVEIASHTYSHPFFWNSTSTSEKLYGDHLPIKDYEIDYQKEILGSLEYINNTLAPSDKKARLLLWSGSANPSEDTLQIAEQNNILNVNGGNTYIVNGDNDLSQVYPHIVWYPSAVQVYAPTINENLYTHLWTEHYDGYARVIESFKLLETPRRLKPISIYYHMYSGRFPASLKALEDIYQWAMAQSVNPMYLSEFASRARTLYDTGIAKTLDGKWQIASTGIKSIRLPHELGYPSTGDIAGYSDSSDGKYLSLLKGKTVFSTSDTPSQHSFLINANGQVKKWQHTSNTISWEIYAHVPLSIHVQLASDIPIDSCRVIANEDISLSKGDRNVLRLSSQKNGLFIGSLECKVPDEKGHKEAL